MPSSPRPMLLNMPPPPLSLFVCMAIPCCIPRLLAKRCGEHFTKDSEFPKGAELGKRIVKLTVEMLDRNLVDSVWWKTLVLIQYASQLVHTKVLHPQNMWNILREIVDEVLSINNSSNRRDAYCYMVLEALLIVGHEMHLFHMEMASSGRKTVDRSDEGEAADGGPPHRQHKPVDFVALFDDVSYYMRNRTNRDTDESTLGMTWKKIQEWHKDDWKECQVALHGKPYMAQASAQHRPVSPSIHPAIPPSLPPSLPRLNETCDSRAKAVASRQQSVQASFALREQHGVGH